MFRQLPPRLPLVWRDPFTLQLGIDRPIARLDHVTLGEEQLVRLLRSGVEESTYQGCGDALEVPAERRDHILARFAPPHHTRPLGTQGVVGNSTIAVTGSHPAGEVLARTLASPAISIAAPHPSAPTAAVRPDLSVICADYAVVPSAYRAWLSTDVAHVPLVFSDETVWWGPVVRPGRGGCLLCAELHRTDTDPSWPAIASQLVDAPSPRHAPEMVLLAVAHLAGDIRAELETGRSAISEHVATLDVATRTVSYRRAPAHPECGCLNPARAAVSG